MYTEVERLTFLKGSSKFKDVFLNKIQVYCLMLYVKPLSLYSLICTKYLVNHKNDCKKQESCQCL